MKKQVNLFLLIVVVAAIGLIAAMSVFYQERLVTLSTDYLQTTKNLSVCEEQLNATSVALELTQSQLTENIKDVDLTVDLFKQKSDELDEVSTNLADREAYIDQLTNLYEEEQELTAELRSERNSLSAEVSSLIQELANKDDEIADLNSIIDDLESES